MRSSPSAVARLRLAVWALTSRRQAKVQLRRDGTKPVRLNRPPAVGLHGTRVVERVLWASRATCLVRSCVLQNWYAASGLHYDVVVGVMSPQGGFRAHAWLDQSGPEQPQGFTELMRIRCLEGEGSE
jgi:hypothetical protein